MKKLFAAANQFIETGDWKIIALMKFCFISLGMLLGMCILSRHKKKVLLTAGSVFLATCIPLLLRFYRIYQAVIHDENGQ